jgi:hypothetical protein
MTYTSSYTVSPSLGRPCPRHAWANYPFIFKASVGSIRRTRRTGTMAASSDTPIINARCRAAIDVASGRGARTDEESRPSAQFASRYGTRRFRQTDATHEFSLSSSPT